MTGGEGRARVRTLPPAASPLPVPLTGGEARVRSAMPLEPASILLRFVPLDRVVLHEEDDPYRMRRLVMALRREGRLRNPPIVSEHDDRYVVLDGATRITALREMGFRDVLVQIVDYEGEHVELLAWHHVIVGLPHSWLLASLADVDGLTLQPVDVETARRLMGTREIAACAVMPNGQWFAVLCEGDENERARRLCRLVAEYRGKAEVHRTVEVDLHTLRQEYPDLTAVIAFPTFTPEEIIRIALGGARLPMGITRHLIAGRALGLDIPLERLGDSQPIEAKNAWLNDLIHKRLQANKIRLYQEPVFVFDE